MKHQRLNDIKFQAFYFVFGFFFYRGEGEWFFFLPSSLVSLLTDEVQRPFWICIGAVGGANDTLTTGTTERYHHNRDSSTSISLSLRDVPMALHLFDPPISFTFFLLLLLLLRLLLLLLFVLLQPTPQPPSTWFAYFLPKMYLYFRNIECVVQKKRMT